MAEQETTIKRISETKPIYKIVNSWQLFDAEKGLQMQQGQCYVVDENGGCSSAHTDAQFKLAWEFLCKHQDLWNEEHPK